MTVDFQNKTNKSTRVKVIPNVQTPTVRARMSAINNFAYT